MTLNDYSPNTVASIPTKVIYLKCPFSDKDLAKALGARWDKNVKQWYVPDGISLEPFQKWLSVGIAPPVLPQEKLASLDGIPQYTIRQFISGLTTAFYKLYPTEIWLMGQITKLKTRGEGIEIQLMDCENNLDLKNACSMAVTAWNEKSQLITTKMQQNGLQLQEGLLINVKVRPKFHQRYHIGGDILDIDPAATLGEFAILQRQIREKLKKEGIYAKNKLLPKPFDYCRVAVIHPPNASGYHDFKKDADILQKLSLCDFIYFASSFEGVNTENEILAALDLALEQHGNNPLDAIIIIRGGGARQGLLNLVKESIVRKICLSPVPVMVGLGHADDKLLLDEVANMSLDTPSKTVAYIRNTIQKNARDALFAYNEIGKVGAHILRTAEKQINNVFVFIAGQSKTEINKKDKKIDEYKHGIISESKIMLSKWQNKLLFINQQLASTRNIISDLEQKTAACANQIYGLSKNILLRTKHNLDISYHDIKALTEKATNHYITTLNHLNELVESFNPEAVLKRGFSLSVNNSYQVIRSVKQAINERAFWLKFYDGQCSVKIDNFEEK